MEELQNQSQPSNLNQMPVQNMPRQNPKKQISSWIGFVIIIAVAAVAFGGVFAYQYFTKSQQNSEFFGSSQKTDQTQTQTAGPALSGVEGWKTYTNTKYGYEFQYPENWVPVITDDGISLTTPERAEQNKNNQNVLPPVFDFSSGFSTNDWFIKNAKSLTGKEFTNLKDFLMDAYGNVAEINIDGKNAYSTVISTSKNDYVIYIETGKNTYIVLAMPYIGPQPGLDPKNPKITTEAKNIISTFKFTDSATEQQFGISSFVANSFDLNNQSFSIISPSGKQLKIDTTILTKIFYTVDNKNFDMSFSDFAKGIMVHMTPTQGCGFPACVGFNEIVKGFLSIDGKTVEATEISWGVQ